MNQPLPHVLGRRVARGRFDLQYRELDDEGIGESHFRRWIRDGHLTPQGGGAYLIEEPIEASDRFEAARIRYVRRCSAVLASVPRAYLVGPSAAAAHHLPLLRMPREVHLSWRPHSRLTRAGTQAHRPWGVDQRVRAWPGPTQHPAQAIVEISARYGVESGLMAADAALHHDDVSTEQLAEATHQYGTRSGARAARRVVRLADHRIESADESRLRHILLLGGVRLTPQVRIFTPEGRFVARVDFVVPGTNVIVEFDGLGKYATPEELRAEKRRQLELERLGYSIRRFVWADLDRPEHIARLVHEALAMASTHLMAA